MNSKTYIEALEIERASDWDQAHCIFQDINTPEAAWIHAYLHRVEGDLGNVLHRNPKFFLPPKIVNGGDQQVEVLDVEDLFAEIAAQLPPTNHCPNTR